jgi:hypothetical protein
MLVSLQHVVSDSRICNIAHCVCTLTRPVFQPCIMRMVTSAHRSCLSSVTRRPVCPHLTDATAVRSTTAIRVENSNGNILIYVRLCHIKPCSPLKVKLTVFRRNISPPSSVSNKPSKISGWKQVTSLVLHPRRLFSSDPPLREPQNPASIYLPPSFFSHDLNRNFKFIVFIIKFPSK